MRKMETKAITFIAIMGALGNVLSFLTTQLAPILPNVPFGPISVSLALDISHLTTFIAALFGGPVIGGVTGAVGGLVAAFEFGFSKGNFVTGIGLPLGKAMTGVAAGILFKRYKIKSILTTMILTLVAYIPEAVLTLVLFRYLLPSLMGLPIALATLIGMQIIAKATFEMIVLGAIVNVLIKNPGLEGYIENYFPVKA
jgi:hypothetical protein